ncbi:MAG: tetratricopeptide repeat protein [Dehalococcoidia bacterium]
MVRTLPGHGVTGVFEGRGRRSHEEDDSLAMGRNHLLLKEFSDAGKRFERCPRDFSGAPSEPDTVLGLGEALLGQKKTADARRMLRTLATSHPSSSAAAEAARLLESR